MSTLVDDGMRSEDSPSELSEPFNTAALTQLSTQLLETPGGRDATTAGDSFEVRGETYCGGASWSLAPCGHTNCLLASTRHSKETHR